jgi:hypothetical protein
MSQILSIETFTGQKTKRQLLARRLLQYCHLPDKNSRDFSRDIWIFFTIINNFYVLVADFSWNPSWETLTHIFESSSQGTTIGVRSSFVLFFLTLFSVLRLFFFPCSYSHFMSLTISEFFIFTIL